MPSFYNIWTITKFEIRIIWRSWFYRIFSLLSIGFISFFMTLFTTKLGFPPWSFSGIPAMMPYFCMSIFNIAQALIAIFLTTDFMQRDRKHDTSKVVYSRSISNIEYVVGKILAIIIMLLVLNLILLLISSIMQIFFTDVSFRIIPYIVYPLLINIPSLLFIIGLTALIMNLIKNQAVTFILMLGFSSLILFYAGSRFENIFDFFGFYVPYLYSDFIGFGDVGPLLLLRFAYLSLGLMFIFFTISFYKRLIQARTLTQLVKILSIVAFCVSAYLFYQYMARINRTELNRVEYKAIVEEFIDAPRVTMTDYSLKIQHTGDKISGAATIHFVNNTDQSLNSVIFSMNPGLHVHKIENAGKALSYERRKQVIVIKPGKSLVIGQKDSINIAYSGTPTTDYCYLDIDKELRRKTFRIFFYRIAKLYSILKPDYVCLTPESSWYPVAGLRIGDYFPYKSVQEFINFDIEIETASNLTAITQGNMIEFKDLDETSRYHYATSQPVPQLSLVVGEYEQRSIEVDSVLYSIYTKPGHDYFVPYFDAISDTLQALIKETKDEYELKLQLSYPYERLSIIETPIQFFSHPRVWSQVSEQVQPEHIYLSEFGIFSDGTDFQNAVRRSERRSRRTNQTETPLESQSNLFKWFVRSVITGTDGGFRFGDVLSFEPEDKSVFGHYYRYIYHFVSNEIPIFNNTVESYLKSKLETPENQFFRNFRGLTDDEKSNIALSETSLRNILQDSTDRDLQRNALDSKGKFLFQYIKSQVDEDKFNEYFNEIMATHSFSNILVEDFTEDLEKKFQFDLHNFFDDWYTQEQLPAFTINDVQCYKIMDEGRMRSQVIAHITNSSPTPGIVSFYVSGRRDRRFRRGFDQGQEIVSTVSIDSFETKEIAFLVDETINTLNIDTHLSKNIPQSIIYNYPDLATEENKKPYEIVRKIETGYEENENEIIVDNEDEGFNVTKYEETIYLRKLLVSSQTEDEKYNPLNFWRPPKQWELTTHSEFFGDVVHSAYYIKPGDGGRTASWTAQIEKPGNYDIYLFVPHIERPFRRRGRQDRNAQTVSDVYLKIHSDDGIEDIHHEVTRGMFGWNYIGTFYYTEGEAKVEISNKSNSDFVFADAMKWVKR